MILVGILVGSCFFILLCLGVVAYLIIKYWRMKREREENEDNIMDAGDDFELQKKETLKERLNALTDDVEKIYEEFKKIESIAKEEALVETSAIAAEVENRTHNRYLDIGQQRGLVNQNNVFELCILVPYDSNIVTLQTPTGNPPTTYINASIIRFNDMKPDFIATQAPKLNTFENFWQMVLEKEVSWAGG